MRPAARAGALAARARSRATAAAAALALAGCAREAPPLPSRIAVGPVAPAGWPSPEAARAGSPPRVEAMRFSSLEVPLGTTWSGDVVATSNTTRVELKTNLFDVSLPRTAPGRFAFRFDMLDMPTFLVRPYVVHVIASDASGAATHADVDLHVVGPRPVAPPRA